MAHKIKLQRKCAPGQNIHDLLKCLNADESTNGVKVLMSSGLDMKEQSQQYGADGFILKPYMPDDLVGRIRDTLKMRA